MPKTIPFAAGIMICALVVSFTGIAGATSYTLGGVESVGSGHGMDAFKNPGYLPFHKTGTKLTFITTGKPLPANDGMEVVNMSTDDIIYTNSAYVAAQLFTGFVKDSGERAWGLALGTLDKGYLLEITSIGGPLARGQFLYSKDENHSQDNLKQNSCETTYFNPAIAYSYGFMVTPRDGIGLQLITGYAREEMKFELNQVGIRTMITDYQISSIYSMISLGYYKRMGNTDLGIMIKSGVFSVETWSRSMDDTAAGPVYYHDESSTSPDLMYTYGASLVAGVYTRQFSWVGACLEAEVSAPATYRRTKLNYDGGPHRFVDLDWRVQMPPSVALRGGFEFFLDRWMVLSIGGCVKFESVTQSINYYLFSGQYYQKQSLMTSMLTLGLDYYFSSKVVLIMGAHYTIYRMKTIDELADVGTTTKNNLSLNSFDLMLGMSFSL